MNPAQRRSAARLSVLASALLPLSLAAQSQPAKSAGAKPAVARAQTPSAVAIAPDGKTIAWTAGGRGETQLTLTALAQPGSAHLISPPGACANTAPAWSPDGAQLAFLSTCGTPAGGPGQQQIFLYTPADAKIRQLTHVAGNLQQLTWSPDGKHIGFLFVENATRSAGALDAMKPWSGVIGEDGIEPQRIAIADSTSGIVLQVTPATLHAFEFDWAPDSRSLALIAAPNPGENNWWVAKLYTADLNLASTTSGADRQDHLDVKLHAILDPQKVSGSLHGLQIAVPRFSPDGKQIAFIGGLMSDQGSTGGDIYTIPATGGQPKDLTAGRDASPSWFQWTNAHTLEVSEDARGYTHLFLFNTTSMKDEPGTDLRYQGSLASGGIKSRVATAGNGAIAVVRSSFSEPPEIWAGPLASLQQVTHLNSGAHAAATKTESIEWTNEGFRVQGWLTYPVNYDARRRYPLIVSVHGGPSSSIGARWGSESSYADAGYFVFQPNPRGSFGQGETFTQANVKDFGYGDLRDVLAGMDAVEKKVSIDRDREGLTGWSYGGFMTMFAVTQTHRFHAAVAGAGISNWKSYYGENSIDQWMVPFFGATVYDDPAVYAKSSAIEFIKQVTTPTLVIVGDRDGECPAPQSFEFWHALRAEGVKTQLVIYPNEGHGFRDPAHIADRQKRTLAWFAENMPEAKQTATLH